MNITDLSSTQLRKAASVKEQIENLQNELVTLLGSSIDSTGGFKKKRTMSAAARAKIAAAQRARWAKQKAAKK